MIVYTTEKMTDAFRPRRYLLYRRLWGARCCGDYKTNNDSVVEDVRRQKALVRKLTKMLTTSQLDTLVRIVTRRTYQLTSVICSYTILHVMRT